MKQATDHPVEDVFGSEILTGDVYWLFGGDVVNDINLRIYLMERQRIQCYESGD